MSISAWPTPTVSMKTSSLPDASISRAACRVASERPPRAPRLAIERMNTPASRKWSERRIRSPRRAPRVNGLEGSIERTATWRSSLRISAVSAPISVLLPTPGGPGPSRAWEHLPDELPALRVVVLDQGDPSRQRALVTRDQAPGEGLLCLLSHRAAESRSPGGRRSEPRLAPVQRAFRFYRRNGMLNLRYARLLWRYLWRRYLTPAGWRWETDGPVFFGKALQLQIGKRATIRFGRFSWIGDGTKIRCHEGVVEIGPKTVVGQECTISAYKRVRIGEQCVIADRAMFIDFDHGVVEVERPIRVQGIYTRECVIGSNVWVGYGACFLRGVHVGDNAIVGTNSVVTRDVQANAVVGGVPAKLIRMREVPRELRWPDPVEPEPD